MHIHGNPKCLLLLGAAFVICARSSFPSVLKFVIDHLITMEVYSFKYIDMVAEVVFVYLFYYLFVLK